MRSEEFTTRLTRSATSPQLNLRTMRPERYRETIDRSNGQTIAIFDAKEPSDFDWLERAILEHGYYERPGVWNFGIDTDKRLISEIVAAFAPKHPLEIGCAAGAVLSCLADLGIDAEGVEISSMAIARAQDRVRERIHRGDLLSLDMPRPFDMVFGLDVFEHLNPNRIDEYILRIARITTSDAYLFCNVPAFGEDAIFGTVFPLYVEGWESDAAAGRPFTALHVDDVGYPIHGHLTWADARWWVERFERAGFTRDLAIERELHRKYDRYFDARARARKAFFVFGKERSNERRAGIVEAIRTRRSAVLD
jgi:methyltransferase family protein